MSTYRGETQDTDEEAEVEVEGETMGEVALRRLRCRCRQWFRFGTVSLVVPTGIVNITALGSMKSLHAGTTCNIPTMIPSPAPQSARNGVYQSTTPN